MNSNIDQKHWTTCLICHGLGKVTRAPSRKKARLYREALIAFEANHELRGLTAPVPPQENIDVCSNCDGSGLRTRDSAVQPDIKNYPSIAIIGGGIGGVALAVACLHRGIPFTLYERDKSFDARSQGYGLTLQQASKAMKGLGILSLDGGITSTKHIVHTPDGKIIGEWGLRKWKKTFLEKTSGRKNIHIARQSLRSILLEQLDDSPLIQWGYSLIDFSGNKDGSTDLHFQVSGKIETTQADLVVGADGIRSRVRELLIGDKESPLQYLGCIVILGICPLQSLDSSFRLSPSFTSNTLLDSATVFQTVNGRERMYVMPYDANTIMWQLSFPMSEIEAKELSAEGAKAMKNEACARLREWHDPIPQILAATDVLQITGYPVYDRELLDPKLLQEKRTANNTISVTLLGDSAHPMSPFKGQGANQAILDALSLARIISTKCGPDSDWRKGDLRKSILDEFEKEMLERTASKVRDSAKAAKLLHCDDVLQEGDAPRGR